MGTLSKRPLRDFGDDIKDRIEDFRSSVGSKLDSMQSSASGREGALARALEKVTASLSPSTWLAFAGASLVGSFALQAVRKNHASIFVGQFVPTFLVLGLYNRLVKLANTDHSTVA